MVKLIDRIAEQLEGKLWPILVLLIIIAGQRIASPGMHMDGALYALIGKRLALNSNWLVPSFSPTDLNPFFEHPPFFFWVEALFFKVSHNFLGISLKYNWMIGRLCSISWACLLIVASYKLLRKECNSQRIFIALISLILIPLFLKLSRYPNLDMAYTSLSIFACSYYWDFFKAKNNRSLVICGLFFGLSMLIKGHAALIVLLPVSLHYLLSNIDSIKNRQWGAIFKVMFSIWGISLMVFLVWPVSLAFKGQYSVFQQWFLKQFVHTAMEGRGQESNHIFTYFIVLLKTAGPWFLAVCWVTYKWFKTKKISDFTFFIMLLFWFPLIFLSLFTWKYSHYLVPIFFPMAYLSSDWFESFKRETKNKLVGTLALLGLVTVFVLPITSHFKKRYSRDEAIQKIVEYSHKHPELPKNWAEVDGAYGYWLIASHLMLELDVEVSRIINPNLIEHLKTHGKEWVYIFKRQKMNNLSHETKELLYQNFELGFAIPEDDLVIFKPRRLR